MWRLGMVLLGASLAAITPGAALLAIQQWTPAVLAIAGLAGSALAVGLAAYRKATANQRTLAQISRHIPKRSTDTPIVTRHSGASAMPGAIIPGPVAGPIAGSRRGEVEP